MYTCNLKEVPEDSATLGGKSAPHIYIITLFAKHGKQTKFPGKQRLSFA